jgi:putative pyruvate formate lyase activating enzyme
MLERLKASGDLRVPVVYNTSGYERVETLRRLDGLVDIYLPDFKYFSNELSALYSSASDYREVATEALREMLWQRGKYRYSDSGELLLSGVVVRHLVLPSHRKDSIDVLRHIAATFGTDDLLLSLMSQYTPDFALDTPYPELHRRVTSFEYSSVCREAELLGFDGFFQSRASASSDITPDFK